MRPLSHAACSVLRGLTRSGDLVFPATRGKDRPTTGFTERFARVAKLGELPPDVTPHVLRHTFATLAIQKGISLAAIQWR